MLRILKLVGVAVLVVIALAGIGLFSLTEQSKNANYCSGCHLMDSYVASMKSPNRLAAQHAQRGIACQECHPQTTEIIVREFVDNVTRNYQEPLDEMKFVTKDCLRCHGTYAQVAERTKNFTLNPHDSHNGDLDCRICHKAHQDSILYCSKCHEPIITKAGWKNLSR